MTIHDEHTPEGAAAAAAAAATPAHSLLSDGDPTYAHIHVLLDRSGSMMHLKSDVIGGFNTFIDSQKKVAGKCTVTLSQFDTIEPYAETYCGTELANVKALDDVSFQPRGGTPLYDAATTAIASCRSFLSGCKDKPGKLVFVIITDGEENASTGSTKDKVKKHIEELTGEGWQFVYLGIGIDAMADGGAIGIHAKSTFSVQASAVGTHTLYGTLADATTCYRAATTGATINLQAAATGSHNTHH